MTLITGFSSVLAYGLNQMDGIQGLAGWQWIFIIVSLKDINVCFSWTAVLIYILGGGYYRCYCLSSIHFCYRLPRQTPPTPQAVPDCL